MAIGIGGIELPAFRFAVGCDNPYTTRPLDLYSSFWCICEYIQFFRDTFFAKSVAFSKNVFWQFLLISYAGAYGLDFDFLLKSRDIMKKYILMSFTSTSLCKKRLNEIPKTPLYLEYIGLFSVKSSKKNSTPCSTLISP